MWYKIGTQVGEYSLQPPTPWMFVVSTRRKHVNSPSGERGGGDPRLQNWAFGQSANYHDALLVDFAKAMFDPTSYTIHGHGIDNSTLGSCHGAPILVRVDLVPHVPSAFLTTKLYQSVIKYERLSQLFFSQRLFLFPGIVLCFSPF